MSRISVLLNRATTFVSIAWVCTTFRYQPRELRFIDELTNMRFAAILGLLSVALAEQLQITSRNVETGAKTEVGILDFDASTSDSTFHPSAALTAGSYCIGTTNLPRKDCFTYLEVSDAGLGGSFVLYVDEHNKVSDIAFFLAPSEIQTTVQKIGKGPVPNLSPSNAEKVVKPPTQKVIRKKVVETEDGETVEIEEEVEEIVTEDNRSWVQKNYIYIVPALLVAMVLLPDGEEKEEKSK